jgi:hypothetical protein
MEVIFKIFLLLFLKQSMTVLKDTGNYITIANWQGVAISQRIALQIQGERTAVEELINQFSVEFPAVNILKNNEFTAQPWNIQMKLLFIELPYSSRNKITERLKLMQTNISFQWSEFLPK